LLQVFSQEENIVIKYLSGGLAKKQIVISNIDEVCMWNWLNSWNDSFSRRRSSFTVMSFFIPFFLLASCFAIQQVHPFGDKMILTVDAYHQYAPFVVELRNKILSGDSLFYSWNIGLGTNFWAVFANYAASPLNLISLLFPTKLIPDAIALIACLRAGLAGLFMSFLLRDLDKGRKDLFLCAFATLYAMCGWVLSYFWNIMWMDAVVLLPLVVLGMRKMFRDGKPLLYCISLFFCLWSNFFTGYFICLFMLLYAPVCYITAVEKKTLKNLFSSVGRFSLYSLIGGGMAGLLLYPTYVALKHASATGDAFPKDYELTNHMFDFFSRFFIGSQPIIREGMANVFSGVLVLIFLPLFFLCPKIKLKEKIGYGALILIMYFSFSSRILDFIWHGFHFPNQIPYRQAFLMSFLLVIVAYKVLRNLKSFTVSDITISVMLILAYMVIYEKFGEGSEKFLSIAVTAFFVIVYGVLLRSILLHNKGSLKLRNILFGVIIVEMIVASQWTVGLVSMKEGFTGWNFYGMKESQVRSFLEEKEDDPEVGPFFRAEIYPAHVCNLPALYDMKGISVFSSTARESYIKFMKTLGLHNNGINSTRNNGLTEVTASLFGIRYLVDLETESKIPTTFDVSDEVVDGLRILENEDALSLGYMVSPDILNFEVAQKSNPFITTNDYLKALGVEAVYEARTLIPGVMENAEFTGGNAMTGFNFSAETSSDEKTKIAFSIEPVADGTQLYLFESSRDELYIKVMFEEPDTTVASSSSQYTRVGQIVDLGQYGEKTWKSAELSWSDLKSSTVNLLCYSVNEEAFNNMISTLSESPLEVTSYDSTTVKGTVNAKEAGVLLLSIPYEEGWTAYVDGQKAEIHNIAGAFCGLSLASGNHEISMIYKPDGVDTGLLISIASFGLLLLIISGKYALRKFRDTSDARRPVVLNTTEPLIPEEMNTEVKDSAAGETESQGDRENPK
jgi:uncharacterized membrane protein YfhO